MPLSFQYCCLCLENYYKNPTYQDYNYIYFFVSSCNQDHEHYIALVQMHIKVLQKLHAENRHFKKHKLINLKQIAYIIHLEKGSINNQIRLKTIMQYYKKRFLLTSIQQELIA
jgi:hypothetical protein